MTFHRYDVQFRIGGHSVGRFADGRRPALAILVVDEVQRVDGNPVTLSAKNYTSSDDNTEMRANIYNDFVSRFPEDAHNAGGQLSGEFGEYSSKIVDPASFAKWQRVEVDFTVSGIGDAE